MWVMYNYYVDWEEFNLISRYVKSGDEVFDIGANMGYYTIWMSKFIGNGRIHSFEPDIKNFERLNKNIAINRLTNQVVSNKKAAGDMDGEIDFTTGLDGENHISNQTSENLVTIQSTQIDKYASENNIGAIAYMKIDVEGFEYAVLKGSNTFLVNKKIDIIQLEINNTICNSGKSITDLLELLSYYRYELCRFDVDKNQLIATEFVPERENYFAVYSLDAINVKLKNIAK
jgi:FkbM family methyltransferase